ncbi:Zinc finger CCCH domain-containing protein [Schistosoma japonicum]|uniref:Zinc finger CCCH domain-containing protein n=1 Tax=Schistosoma japonicum TaxID=6182 RepID=A0A4Z2D2N6_SCHJA|nr:Zinc finger CCCH domain-containing protein [Schistosoma japonicum]
MYLVIFHLSTPLSINHSSLYSLLAKLPYRFDKTFCHDFQNSTCRRPNCKFLHYTKEEEEIFRRTGYLPNDSQWSYRPALNTSDEKTPICKDFCNGACNRGSNCKYRHVTLSQEAINHGLFNQHSLQEAGFTNTNMSSVRFDPSIMKISNPTVASHFGQSSLINRAVIVSPNNSILNPVSNSYIPVASSHSIVGLIGNTSTGQPTLYTHSPLVSLTSAPHITPCSSVITVSPDPLQNPNILHPQTALPAPHTTYHIVPHDASHHHLLATSSSHSHAPTLLTIPLSQFTCNVSNNSLIQSQAAITCSTQHHAVVTGVLPTDSSISTAPGTYFPSYSVFHINQPSLETHDHHLQQQITTETQKQIHKTEISPCSTTVITPVTATSTTTTSVASSTTAVLAAAAAAGYIARHLPVIGPSNVSEGGTISQDHSNNILLNHSNGVNVHESALAAAANLPTVSAAAAAAVAAAAAFARSSSITQNSKCCAVIPNVQIKSNELDTELNLFNTIANISAGNNSSTDSCSCQDSSQVSCMKHDNIDPTKTIATNTVTTSFIQSYSTLESSNTSDDNNNSTSNNSNNSIKLISPTDPGSMPCSGSSSSDYLNPTDEEQAKTAAAVAAAACIGAIFSQPMAAAAAAASSSSGGGGNSASSSVAAMLGSLISRNSQDIIQAVQSSSSSSPCGPSLLFNSSRHICSSSGKSTSGRDVESSVGHHSLQQHQQYFAVDERNIVNELNERGNCVNLVNKSVDQHNSTIQSNVVNTSSSSASLVSSSDRCKCTNSSLDSSYSFQNVITSDTNTWSSVTTTMASAAKAAAAAAVAATAAVTGSANFFRLTQFKNKVVDPQLHDLIMMERVASSVSPPCAASPSTSTYSPLRCIDQSRSLRLNPDHLSSSVVIADTQLSGGLSTKEAVTMSSAAAAAAMVAAATVAAEQRQLIGNNFLSEINHPGKLEKQNTYRTTTGNSRLPKNSECDYHRTCSSSSSHNDFASPSSYETDNHIYSLTHDESNRYPAKRHKTKRLRSVDCRYSGCSSLHHHTDLTRSSVDDYEDDDPDVYEDDDIESTALMSPSPEVTPPYNPPAKLSKRKGLLSLSYSRQVEDSRPASCETSPDPWVSTSHKIVMSRTTNKSDCLENHPSQSLSTLQFSNYQSSEHGKGSFCVANSTPHPELLSTNSTGSYYYYPIRRSLSTGVLPLKTSCKIIPKKRSKSFPVLNSFHSHLKEEKQVFLVSSNSSRRHNITESFSIRPAMSGTSTSLCCSKDGSMNKFLSSRYRNRIFVRKRFRRITHRYSAQHPNNRRFLMRNTRPLSNVSPTSILSEEYSGRDEGDDPDFVDPDYDDDLYELPVPQTSSKRSPHGIPKYSTKRKRSVYSSTSNLHIAPPSIKQQYALRIENARLRRKLIDLMRQRGDLRAANEMLLEQNARLRQSSKRVSAVARMAESATKIIEAHNKSQLAQSSGFSSSSGGASQSTVPFSIAQAAAAVVAAAAQNQTNAPNLTGVYVSSPTASINQQHSPTINTLGGVSGGNSSLHTLFPQIPPANATGIAIPSNQALTAVQIQAPPGALAAPPPQATALIHHQQTLDPQQSGISNYYQHQMNRPLETASIANASVSPTIQNISQPSSTFQVCHYPVVSIASVFPKLSQDVSAENPKLVSVGAPNTVTLLLGQSTPQTPTYAIPASVSSHPNVPLQIPVTVGTHLTPAVSCPPHHGPTKLVVSVAYPNQAAAVANVMPTTSTHYVSPNPVNNQTSVLPNQIQIVHKLTTTHHSACTK